MESRPNRVWPWLGQAFLPRESDCGTPSPTTKDTYRVLLWPLPPPPPTLHVPYFMKHSSWNCNANCSELSFIEASYIVEAAKAVYRKSIDPLVGVAVGRSRNGQRNGTDLESSNFKKKMDEWMVFKFFTPDNSILRRYWLWRYFDTPDGNQFDSKDASKKDNAGISNRIGAEGGSGREQRVTVISYWLIAKRQCRRRRRRRRHRWRRRRCQLRHSAAALGGVRRRRRALLLLPPPPPPPLLLLLLLLLLRGLSTAAYRASRRPSTFLFFSFSIPFGWLHCAAKKKNERGTRKGEEEAPNEKWPPHLPLPGSSSSLSSEPWPKLSHIVWLISLYLVFVVWPSLSFTGFH